MAEKRTSYRSDGDVLDLPVTREELKDMNRALQLAARCWETLADDATGNKQAIEYAVSRAVVCRSLAVRCNVVLGKGRG